MDIRSIDRRRLLVTAGGVLVFGACRSPATARQSFQADPFSLGVASGDPAPDGFVIWTRLAPRPLDPDGGMTPESVDVDWEVAEDEAFTRVVRSGSATARPEMAHAVHVEVEGLRPRRPYFYRFRVEGADYSRTGTARTAPAPGDRTGRVRIASAGCQKYEVGYYGAWAHLAREPDLDAVFHYGDYIYEGRQGPAGEDLRLAARAEVGPEARTLEGYRRRYALYKLDPQLQAAHAAVAFICSYDDHEVENNWVSDFDTHGSPVEALNRRRAAAMQAWYEHMPLRAAQRPRGPAVQMYRALDFGGVTKMHVLDTRQYRTNQPCQDDKDTFCRVDVGSETMLGTSQERWLADGLSSRPAWNLIAQQVMVMPFDQRRRGASPVWSVDKWSGYPQARERLVRSILDKRLSNVVIASGDHHRHVVGYVPVRDAAPDGPAAAVEFLATSISSGGNGSTSNNTFERVQRYNPNVLLHQNQRGYQVFDVTAGLWTTELKVVDQVERPDATLSTLARYVVEPGRVVTQAA